jgi:thioredoxin
MITTYVTEVTSDNFDEKIKSSEIAIVDIWADWCGPCKQFAPVFVDVAASHGGELSFAKVDVDEAPELASRFSVMSIPTIVVVSPSGETLGSLVGARPKVAFEEFLSSFGAKPMV